jgi:sulfite exporter TauE/SafE
MQTSLWLSALVMGLVGGPHCVLMCGAACAGIAKFGGQTPGASSQTALWRFQLSRVLGYALLGAFAAGSVQGMAWMGEHTAVIRPLWIMMHVAALVLGGWLLWWARQPAWVDGWGQQVWRKAKPLMTRLGPRAPVLLGLGWALMPCGLLYSALLVASLSADVVNGAVIMAAFALGTVLTMSLAPWLLLRLRGGASGAWGMRWAGVALMATSGWALWRGLTQPTGLWCL